MSIYAAAFATIDALHAADIPYMLAGSLSSMYYSISRSTVDADFVIEFKPGAIAGLRSHLPSSLQLDPQTSFETVTMTVKNVIQVVDTPFKIELFRLSDDPFDRERFSRRQAKRLMEREVFLPTVEDVIVQKLRWSRKKDREDLQALLGVQQGTPLDWNYIHRWADIHGTRGALEEIRQSIPPLD